MKDFTNNKIIIAVAVIVVTDKLIIKDYTNSFTLISWNLIELNLTALNLITLNLTT